MGLKLLCGAQQLAIVRFSFTSSIPSKHTILYWVDVRCQPHLCLVVPQSRAYMALGRSFYVRKSQNLQYRGLRDFLLWPRQNYINQTKFKLTIPKNETALRLEFTLGDSCHVLQGDYSHAHELRFTRKVRSGNALHANPQWDDCPLVILPTLRWNCGTYLLLHNCRSHVIGSCWDILRWTKAWSCWHTDIGHCHGTQYISGELQTWEDQLSLLFLPGHLSLQLHI